MIGHPEVKTIKATVQTVINSMKNQSHDPFLPMNICFVHNHS